MLKKETKLCLVRSASEIWVGAVLFFFCIVYGEYFSLIKLLLQHVSVHLKSYVGRSVAVSDEGRTFCFWDFSSPFCSWLVSSRLFFTLSPVRLLSKLPSARLRGMGTHKGRTVGIGTPLKMQDSGDWDTLLRGTGIPLQVWVVGDRDPSQCGVVRIGRMLCHTSFPFV